MTAYATVMTPVGVLTSTPSRLFEAKATKTVETPKFWVQISFTEATLATPAWHDVEKAVNDLIIGQFKGTRGVRSPIRTDLDNLGIEDMGFGAAVSVNNETGFPVVHIDGSPAFTVGGVNPLADREVFEAMDWQVGTKLRAMLRLFTYSHSGNKGVAARIAGIQFAGAADPKQKVPVRNDGINFGALAA